VSLQQIDALDAIVTGQVLPKKRGAKALVDLVVTAQAIIFIGLGLAATLAWIAFLGSIAYLLFRHFG
jgi:uncharacterized membrane protein